MPFSLLKLSKPQLLAASFLVLGAVTVFSISSRTPLLSKGAIAPATRETQAKGTLVPRSIYVNRGALQSQLREVIKVLGDRLEKPGKERLAITGVITRTSKQAEKQPARLIMEFPNKLRLEESDSVTIFDGKELKNTKSVLKKEEEDDIESLLIDSVDQFFTGLIQGQALRSLGARFKDTSEKPGIVGDTFYDLYQMVEIRTVKKEAQQQPKLYYFNSNSLLLEKISYQTKRNGKPIKVEVQLSDWKKVDGQQLPGRITRLEDGLRTLSLEVTSMTVSPTVGDGIFTLPNQ